MQICYGWNTESAKLHCTPQDQGLVPFEAIYAPERSGDRLLIPVRASLIGQSWVLELGLQFSLKSLEHLICGVSVMQATSVSALSSVTCVEDQQCLDSRQRTTTVVVV